MKTWDAIDIARKLDELRKINAELLSVLKEYDSVADYRPKTYPMRERGKAAIAKAETLK